jgi:hypothetical protein
MTTNNVTAAAATLEDAHNHDDMLDNMPIPLPVCFEMLRQNRTNGIYLDLSEHCFTAEEKMYFCNQVKIFPNKLGPLGGSFKELVKRYKLNQNTANKWRRRFNKGLQLHNYYASGVAKSDRIMIQRIISNFVALEANPAAVKNEAAAYHRSISRFPKANRESKLKMEIYFVSR